MTCCSSCNSNSSVYAKPQYRLAEFFNAHWDKYVQKPKHFIRPEEYKAVKAIRSCRTESLGIDYYACPDCGDIKTVYHSCKNRFCPSCSWKDTVAWGADVKKKLFNIPHRHVVFTLPHSLNGLIKENKKSIFKILSKATSDTISDWMHHRYRLTPGIITVLHTAGEKKKAHYHIHMILSWGGFDDNNVLHAIEDYFVNDEFIAKKFRIKFEDALVKLFNNNDLKHYSKNEIQFKYFLKHVNKKSWIVHFEKPMDLPELVIRYIGRYSKRACLSERKITSIDGESITFEYKDYKDKDLFKKAKIKTETLHYTDFFSRLLQHVPVAYSRLVKYYKGYSVSFQAKLKRLEVFTGEVVNNTDSSEDAETLDDTEVLYKCKTCDTELEYLYTVFKKKNGELVYMSRFSPKKLVIEKSVA